MSHSLPTSIRVNQQAKDQLIKLKRITGIKQWNVLCRWALCMSLSDPTPPLVRTIRADSNVEMTWRTFAGPIEAPLEAALVTRMRDGGEGFEDLSDLLTAHLHRGVGQLAGTLKLGDSVADLLELACGTEAGTPTDMELVPAE